MPPLQSDTKELQSRLAAFTRDGEARDIGGAKAERISHYRRLVFSVVSEALTSTYPLAVKLMTDIEWKVLCQEFFQDHACQHPQVWRMPEELIGYIDKHQPDLLVSYPFLLDLLRLEWLESEYYMMPDLTFEGPNTMDIISDPWNLNPESDVHTFSYPVYRIPASEIQAEDHGNYYCLVFRQADSGKVKFMDLSPFLAWLIEHLKSEPNKSVRSFMPTIAQRFGLSDEVVLRTNLTTFFQKLKQEGMVR